MEKKSKKKYLIGVLALLLVAIAVGGTVAWLTATSQKTNSFTVGAINDPTTPPGGGEDGDSSISGNLDEPNWKNGSTIAPGMTVVKDPYVGLGKGSEDAYVFVYVENSTGTAIGNEAYFTLNSGWAPVEGKVIAGAGGVGTYSGGLFVWTGSADSSVTAPGVLVASEDSDVWTKTPLFSEVIMPDAATAETMGDSGTVTMKVSSFVYAATQSTVEGSTGGTADAALSDAKTWANHPTGPAAQ